MFAPVAASAPLPGDDPPLAWVALSAPSGLAELPSNIQTSGSALLPNTGLKPEEPARMTALALKPAQAESSAPIEALVRQAFPDAPVMVEVARAESQFNPHADNPKSTAYGVFQILEGTWADPESDGLAVGTPCNGNRGNPHDNIRCARRIYDALGTGPWGESQYAWGS